MTNYELVIDLMAEKIKSQNGEISLLKWKIENLKKKLEMAEYHLDPTPEKAQELEIR